MFIAVEKCFSLSNSITNTSICMASCTRGERERCAERPVLTTIDLQVTSFGNVSKGGAPKRKEREREVVTVTLHGRAELVACDIEMSWIE
jgi:hypothetical protein